jgi:uncharacterized membrane protein
MLHWSSCLFATVVLHAYHIQCVGYHHVFLMLTVSSLLFHCLHHPVVRVVDKFLAHLAYVMVVFDTPKALAADALWLLVFPVMSACAWFGQSFWPERKDPLHLGVHLIGVCGMHAYLEVLY